MRTVTRVRGAEQCHLNDCSTVDYLSFGLCNKHYKRWQKWGDPLYDGRLTVAERFWSKVDLSDACWIWTGARDINGYGKFNAGATVEFAHRVAYELVVGPIPEGLTLDHLCRVPACANPDHLEPVTQAENTRRARRTGYFGNANRCARGHDWDKIPPVVVRRSNGKTSRTCRACETERRRDPDGSFA